VTWVGERVVADLRTAVYRRVVHMDPLFFETTRVGEVLSRLTTDTTLVQAISGVNFSIILRSSLSLIGSLVLLAITSAKLTGVILVLIPGGRRAAHRHRPARARPVARLAGPHRGHERPRGRDLECDPNGAGVHVGGAAKRTLPQRGRGELHAAVRRTKVRAVLTAVGIMFVFAGIIGVLWLGAHQVLPER
jgi:ATP-binding cassette subfamily B protein